MTADVSNFSFLAAEWPELRSEALRAERVPACGAHCEGRRFPAQPRGSSGFAQAARNQPLTSSDLAELERMLAESGAGSPEQIARAAYEAQGLGRFVRSLVGLDRQAATQAFDEFVKGRIMTAAQLQFVDMMIGHLTENGIMEPGLLYEWPFTSLAPLGPEQLFDARSCSRCLRTSMPRHA